MEKNGERIKKKIFRLTGKLDKRTLAIWAADCAEHILPYFEKKYPRDKRPRKAIEAARAWIRGETNVTPARKAAVAAHAAAREAKDETAKSVARSAGHAVATAHSARHALGVTYYTAKVLPEELGWQYRHLRGIYRKIHLPRKRIKPKKRL